MADKKESQKVVLEREYNVPLRKGWLKVPLYKRSKKAVKVLREFLVKHMKSDDIKLGMHLNEYVWKHGIRNPPHHVKVKAVKYDDGMVKVELEGFEFKEAVKAKPKEEKAEGLKGKLQEVLGKKDDSELTEEKPKVEEKAKEEKKKETVKKEVKKPEEKKVSESKVKKEKTADKPLAKQTKAKSSNKSQETKV